MQQTHTHKAVTGRVEAKKLLSHRRQSEYSILIPSPHLLKSEYLNEQFYTFDLEPIRCIAPLPYKN